MEPNDGEDQQPPDAPDSHQRELLLAAFLLLLTQTRKKLTDDVTLYLSGSITLAVLSDRLVTVLDASHTSATVLGRQLAGYGFPIGAGDAQFAASILAEQEEYLAGLLEDLRDGRYGQADTQDGSSDGNSAAVGGALAQRLLLYAKSLRSTALESFALSQGPSVKIYWQTTAKESCACCLDMEAGSPYTSETLTTFPGQCDCGPNCACLLIAGGTEAFPMPEL